MERHYAPIIIIIKLRDNRMKEKDTNYILKESTEVAVPADESLVMCMLRER